MTFNIPVALVVFNRPDTTARVVEAIAKARPTRLFVIADAPRVGRNDDIEQCAAVRTILARVDWDCDVVTNFATTNLGCQQRLTTGLNWLFDQVEEAIILEDDCVPTLSFFRFCGEVLARYRYDSRIMHITGSNFQLGHRRDDTSYYFSRFVDVWGWATWRRAWLHYDVTMARWPAYRDGGWLADWLTNKTLAQYCRSLLQQHYEGSTTWDFQWMFTCWTQGALSIVPNVNLVENIGGAHAAATHASRASWIFERKAKEMTFPLRHPEFPIADTRADKFMRMTLYRSSLFDRIYGRLWRLLRQQHQNREILK